MSPKSSDPIVMEALESLYASLSPEAQQAFLARSSSSPSPAPEPMGIHHLTYVPADGDKEDQVPSPAQSCVAQNRAARRRQLLIDRKNKKPLNGFMAFRAVYSPTLTGLTQKEKSGKVAQMWNEEPRKALFTLAGQAYSYLRDSNLKAGLDKDFLKKFMAAVTAKLQIIPANDYLEAMGWTRRVDHDGVVTLERNGIGASMHGDALRTNMSVADIVEYCYKMGMVSGQSGAAANLGRNVGGAVSFAAAPTMSAALRRQLWPLVETPAIDVSTVAPLPAAEGTATPSTFAPEFDFNDLGSTLTIEQVTADQQHAFEQLPMPMHFHPGIQPPVLGFDPNMIQDNFDPFTFDDDQYINFDFDV